MGNLQNSEGNFLSFGYNAAPKSLSADFAQNIEGSGTLRWRRLLEQQVRL
jgi:hypothetical protein